MLPSSRYICVVLRRFEEVLLVRWNEKWDCRICGKVLNLSTTEGGTPKANQIAHTFGHTKKEIGERSNENYSGIVEIKKREWSYLSYYWEIDQVSTFYTNKWYGFNEYSCSFVHELAHSVSQCTNEYSLGSGSWIHIVVLEESLTRDGYKSQS